MAGDTPVGDLANSVVDNPHDSTGSAEPNRAGTLDAFFQRKQPSTLPKKIKITADNGQVALRQSRAKKIKREISERKVDMASTRASRVKSKFALSMPLDVLFETFCYLLPGDILQLSRTSKDLRALLRHRSSTFVWKAALSNVPGLPACPEDVSIPFWTNLVFDDHCHGCLEEDTQRFNFLLRVRYCAKCAKTNLLSEWDINFRFEDRQSITSCIPFSVWHSNHKRCTVADRDRIAADFANAKANGTSTRFLEETKKALAKRTLHARSCEAWLKEVNDTREHGFKDVRKERAAEIRKRLTDLKYGFELEFLDGIDKGLWTTVPKPNITRFMDHPCVKIPELLTESDWINIRPRVVRYMRKVCDLVEEELLERIANIRRGLMLNAYNIWRAQPHNLARFPLSSPMPRGVDVLQVYGVKSLLINRDPTLDLTIEDDILPRFDRDLEEGIRLWRTRVMQALLRMTINKGACGDIALTPLISQFHWSVHDNYLRRAVVVFRCTQNTVPRCTGGCPVMTEARAPLMWYPHFLHHLCTSIRQRRSFEKHSIQDALSTETRYDGTCQTPWNTDALELDEKASRATRNVLEACGMDWATTAEELDARDPRVVCLKCTYGARVDGERRFRVWTWRDAVQHCLSAHFGDSKVKWECISPSDTIEARRLEALELAMRPPPPPLQQPKLWRCMKCRDTANDAGPVSWTGLQVHFLFFPTHDPDDGVALEDKEGVVYYKDLDCFPCEGPAVKMVPKAAVPAY